MKQTLRLPKTGEYRKQLFERIGQPFLQLVDMREEIVRSDDFLLSKRFRDNHRGSQNVRLQSGSNTQRLENATTRHPTPPLRLQTMRTR